MTHYEIEGEHLCSGDNPPWDKRGPPINIGVFCGHCGALWARRRTEGTTSWIAYTCPCPATPQNPWADDPVGSLWRLLTKTDTEYLPPEFVLREFELYLDYYEGKEHDN